MVVCRGFLPALVAACAVLAVRAQDAASTPEPTSLGVVASGAGSGAQQLVCHTYIVKFYDAARAAAGNPSATEMVQSGLGNGVAAITGFKSFNSSAFASYVVITAPASTATALAALPTVESVTQDFLVYAASVRMVPLPPSAVPPSVRVTAGNGSVAGAGGGVRGGRRLGTRSGWNPGLDRMDQRSGPLDGAFRVFCSFSRPGGNMKPHVPMDGMGVDVYVLDSGINYDHQEFVGRINTTLARNFVSDGQGYGSTNASDTCLGHGTFVASQIGGAVLGVTPMVRIIPIRVFGCNGAGSYSALLAAVDYIVMTAPTTGRRSIVNFSGAAAAATCYDVLADRLLAAGAPMVVAAGNDGVSACARSPARAASAFTVGASDASDSWLSFSNSGACVNLAAVGEDNIGAWHTEGNAYAVGSGTSFATPLVTGLAAYIWAALPMGTPWSTVTDILTASATRGRLTGLPAGTPDLLAYSGPNGGIEELMATWSATSTVTPSSSGSLSVTPSASGSASVTPSWSISATGTPSVSVSPTGTSTPASLTPSAAATATRSGSLATRSRTASRSRSRVKTSPSRSKSRSQSRKVKPRMA